MKEVVFSLAIYFGGITLTSIYYRYFNTKKRDEEHARSRLTARVIFWPIAKLIFDMPWIRINNFVDKITGVTRRHNMMRQMTAEIIKMKLKENQDEQT